MGVFRLTSALRKRGERATVNTLAQDGESILILVDGPAVLHWLLDEVRIWSLYWALGFDWVLLFHRSFLLRLTHVLGWL